MTERADPADIAEPADRERNMWRRLVLAQLTVVALILVGLLVIYLMGLLGPLFSQRSL